MGNKNIVFIESLPRKTATKISEWSNFETKTNKPLNKTKVGSCTDKLRALYSPKVGGLATGLYKPWMENGKVVKDENGNELILQDKYEQQFNLPEGYLTNELPKKGERPTTYFQTKSWRLNDGSSALDLSTLDGVCGYHVMMESSKVANSYKEHSDHKWPKAKWVIADAQESEEIKFTKNRKRSKAFASLHDSKT